MLLFVSSLIHSFIHPLCSRQTPRCPGLPHWTKQMVPASVKLPFMGARLGALLLWPPARLRYGLSGAQSPARKGTAHTGKQLVALGGLSQPSWTWGSRSLQEGSRQPPNRPEGSKEQGETLQRVLGSKWLWSESFTWARDLESPRASDSVGGRMHFTHL